MFKFRSMSARQLAVYILLFSGSEVVAEPQPPPDPVSDPVTGSITQVTVVATVDGAPVTATFTPTSLAISGLVPPITAATTVTTIDEAGETLAVAIAAGAGIVAAGALAAWLFTPVPNAPPAPTEPPPYSTEEQPDQHTDEPQDPSTSSTTTSVPAACPFPTGGGGVDFKPPQKQPDWTVEIPSATTSYFAAECTSSREIDGQMQLLRGTFPDYINALAAVFCKNDLSKDLEKKVGRGDLPDGSSWKSDGGPEESVEFSFRLKKSADGCAEYCVEAYKKVLSLCQYNSHSFSGTGSLEQGCGTYSLEVKGDPITKLECKGPGDDPLSHYMFRDAAMDAINNFCNAQDGKTVKKGDERSFIKETAFSVTYADQCVGSGEYTVRKDLCVKYLSQAVDNCDTNTIKFKYGGSVEDQDNCGRFEFHPEYYEQVGCWPENRDAGYITDGEHAPVSHDVAVDAINRFCDRSGDGQQYTLDPAKMPDPNGFVQDTCKEPGLAACGYAYRDDGTRVDDPGSLGDVMLRIEAEYVNPNGAFKCSPNQVYEIHGERCKAMLGLFIGDGTATRCVGDDKNKLDLGSVWEVGEKGCVMWNMWAVRTH